MNRYRLSQREILQCCLRGYDLGFRTFVLQGGEDPGFRDEDLANTVRIIKEWFPDVAVTLSVGEKSRDVYQMFREAGADRYLLRHETYLRSHYESLHPNSMSWERRIQCLEDLKSLGYQVGTGFMVGSPHQTNECLAEDLLFIQRFSPQMVGILRFHSSSSNAFCQGACRHFGSDLVSFGGTPSDESPLTVAGNNGFKHHCSPRGAKWAF